MNENDSPPATRLPDGLSAIDSLLRGSGFVLTLGAPGAGKTALLAGMAERAALDDARPVAFFTLDARGDRLLKRIISSRAGVDIRKSIYGNLTEDEWERMTTAAGEVYDAPLMINDTPGLYASEIRERAERRMRAEVLDLIIIDRMELVRRRKGQDLSETAKALKTLARDLRLPVLASSDMGAPPESMPEIIRGDLPVGPFIDPDGSALRMEEEADVVIVVNRQGLRECDGPEDGAEIHVTKHSDGPTGTVRLGFNRRYACFVEAKDD